MKLPFWATVLTAAGVAVLCWLGFWQLERLEWKQDLQASLEAAYAHDAAQTPLSRIDLDGNADFRRGYLTGTYRHDKAIRLQSQIRNGAPGYHILTPFALAGDADAVVLVNRGWIPVERDMPPGAVVAKPEGAVTITGMLRKPPVYNMFVPENRPGKDRWHRIDLAQIAQVKGEKPFVPQVFYVETEEGRTDARYPAAAPAKVTLPDNHAWYAFFWFTMAAVLTVIYLLRFAVPDRTALKT